MASVGPLLVPGRSKYVGTLLHGTLLHGTLLQGPPERERGDDLEHRLRVVGRERASGEAVAQFGHSVSLLTPLWVGT